MHYNVAHTNVLGRNLGKWMGLLFKFILYSYNWVLIAKYIRACSEAEMISVIFLFKYWARYSSL